MGSAVNLHDDVHRIAHRYDVARFAIRETLDGCDLGVAIRDDVRGRELEPAWRDIVAARRQRNDTEIVVIGALRVAVDRVVGDGTGAAGE